MFNKGKVIKKLLKNEDIELLRVEFPKDGDYRFVFSDRTEVNLSPNHFVLVLSEYDTGHNEKDIYI